jgi:hypothetical protein
MMMVLTDRASILFPQVIGRLADVVLFDDSHCQVHVDLQIVNVDMAPRRSLSRLRGGARHESAHIRDFTSRATGALGAFQLPDVWLI